MYKNISVNEKELDQFIIAGVRYALAKNNHLMPRRIIQQAKKYIPLMPNFGVKTAEQLKLEIEDEMRFKKFSEDDEQRFIGFVIWLNDFIIRSQQDT